ncbi:MAG TPA: SGNH/GDSL hydrolase family protein [Actinocrinis sp.]|jgi:lysophospholipase L1-like esterase|uniref:SGNH/GDSL hydrolase family protein n=1 Tax=Actinocrinis sp. TaxID=1920516 RepID=UPI002DDCAD44|nr:SGNH/GDSL hydrolase family protein [Actinocrinis sp.]HEV3171623.1 SGNH/GDSL hydrolase family protein [Actinocrinis sp.]
MTGDRATLRDGREATPAEDDDPYCLRPGEAQALLDGHPWRRFAVLGDSIAEGVSEPVPGYSPLPLADRVAAELSRTSTRLTYLNLGRSGRRTHEVRAGQLASALAFEPDLALVVCGANDALRPGYERRADAVDRDLAAMIRALQACGAEVVTVSIFVRGQYPSLPSWLKPTPTERMALLARRTTALAAELGTLHVDLADHPAAADPSTVSSDGLHGNARSQSVAAAEAVRLLGARIRR